MKYKVISFNIKCDDTIEELKGEFTWDNRKQLLVKYIIEFNADIISFQEVMPHMYEFLKQKLSEIYDSIFVCRDENAKNGEGCPIFFKKDKFVVTYNNTFWLSETPNIPASISWNSRWPRICTYIILKDIQTKTELAIFNTHLDHKSEDARLNGIKLISNTIKEIDLPTILTGDFNCGNNSNTIKYISTKLTNTNKSNNQDITFHLFGNPQILPPEIRNIDFIFCKEFKPLTYKVLNDKPIFNTISDHYAISSDLDL